MSSIVLRGSIIVKSTPGSGGTDPLLSRNPSTGQVGTELPGISSALTDGYILIGNASNVATGVSPSGDITLSNAGVFGISAGVIVNADINASAAIALTKLATVTASRALVSSPGGVITTSSVTDVELNYVSGVTSSIQTQIDTKQATITGAATTITTSDLTPNFALVSSALGKVAVSSISSTKLGYLSGVTSDIQAQFADKLSFSSGITPVQGDIIYFDGAVWNKLAKGSNGQLLVSTASSIQWQTNPTTGLPVGGTTGQYLNKVDGTDYNVQWSDLVWAGLTDVTATLAQVNALATGFYDATSSVQTQLNNKLSTSLANNAILVGNIGNTASSLPGGTNGQVLQIVGGSPQWQTISGTGSVTSVDVSGGSTGLTTTGGPVTTTGTITLSGTLVVSNGGTGRTTNTAYAIMAGGTTSTGALQQVSGLGSAGQVLTSNGAGALPTWQTSSIGVGSDNSFLQTQSGVSAWTTDFFWDSASNNLVMGSNTITTSTNNLINGNNNSITNAGWGIMTGENNVLNGGGGDCIIGGQNNTVTNAGGVTFGYYNISATPHSLVGGSFSKTASGSYPSIAFGFDGSAGNEVLANSATVNISANTGAQTAGHGSLAPHSIIIGGRDHNIPVDSDRSVIIGGDAIKARATNPDQVYVPNFNIVTTPSNDDALTEVLVRDGTTGQIKYRTAASIGGGGTVTSVSGTTNRITSTGGATPVIDIAGTYVGQSSITTTGTLTSGATGAGFTLALGTSTLTGDLPFANLTQISGLSVLGVTGSSTADVAGITGTANQILRVNGAGASLAFGSIDLAQSATVGSSILPTTNGGTGAATFTANRLLIGNGSSAINTNANLTYDGSSLLVANTTNQIVFGTTRTVTINAPTPASASRTWTIPDIGSNGTFMSLEGSQSITGNNVYTVLQQFQSSIQVQGGINLTNGTQLLMSGTAAGPLSYGIRDTRVNSMSTTPGGVHYMWRNSYVNTANSTSQELYGLYIDPTFNNNGFTPKKVTGYFGGINSEIDLIVNKRVLIGTPATTAITANTQVDQIGLGTTSSTINHRWANSSNTVLASLDDDATMSLTHLTGLGSTPSISAGTGAGTGPTVSVTGTDLGGYISVTTGTLPTATATVVTITFSKAYGSAPRCILLTPAGVNAAGLSGLSMVYINQSAITTTTFTITSGTSLAASTTYKWYYYVLQ